MSNIEFLNKLNDDIELNDEDSNFDVDSENEEELDFDLDELISKIDAKMEELNNEDSKTEKKDNDVRNLIDALDKQITDDLKKNSKDELEVRKLIKDIDKKFIEDMKNTNALTATTTSQNEDNIKTAGKTSKEDEQEIRKLIRNIDENFIKSMDLPFENVETNDSKIENIIEKIDSKVESLNEKEKDENKLTADKVDNTNINNIFDKVSVNVKEASNIFMKNIEMKKKLDTRFEELKKLQKDIENSKNNDYQEINDYKDSVLKELTEKKAEIESRLNELKDLQSKFEKEKNEFELYKIESKKEIDEKAKLQKVQDESRKEELENLEDKLRKQKDSLDDEKRQLSLDRIQYEADKNELANNMLKFNEIVGTFTDGVGNLN